MPAIIESGAFRYESLQDWAQLPEGWSFIDASGVAVDSDDNVYVLNRGTHPVIVFDRNGAFLRSFGEGEFNQRAHGIHASPDDFIFTVNDEKGLLLSCIAPEIDTNADTDLFKSCTLAPGRTLDDVMHTFIQGVHYEQSQHEKEREEWQRDLEEKAAQRPAQK